MKSGNSPMNFHGGNGQWPSPIHKDLDPGTLGHIWPVTTPWGFTPLRPHPWGRGYGWLVELHLPVPSCWFGKGRGWKGFFFLDLQVDFGSWWNGLHLEVAVGVVVPRNSKPVLILGRIPLVDTTTGQVCPHSKAMWSPCQDDHREERWAYHSMLPLHHVRYGSRGRINKEPF